METVFVKPTSPDLIVRHPKTGVQLDPEGEIVERSSFWLRRESDGDVELSKPPASRTAATAPKAKPSAKTQEKEG